MAWQAGSGSSTSPAALWLADYIGSFLAQEAAPRTSSTTCRGGCRTAATRRWGRSRCTRRTSATRPEPLAQYFATSLITKEWVQPGDGAHKLYPVTAEIKDAEGHQLVTAYAVERPDGQWALMLVNKDRANAQPVRVSFRDEDGRARSFTGPVTVTTFGAAQYVWRAKGKDGRAAPDGPPATSKRPGGPATTYTLPRASLTVLRGKVATRAPQSSHMTTAELAAFLARHKFVVQASVAADGAPQAAVIGVASDGLTLYFDTLGTSRKGQNLRRDPRIALVIREGAETVQLEGVVDEPTGDERPGSRRATSRSFPTGPSASDGRTSPTSACAHLYLLQRLRRGDTPDVELSGDALA